MTKPIQLTEQEITIRRRLKDDFQYYASKCLKIRTKAGEIQPFVINDGQRIIHETLEQQKAKTGKVRALILKARQIGSSTYCAGRFYWQTTHRRGVRTMILAHEEKASANIFELTNRYHQYAPDLIKPKTGASNAKELHFADLDSGYLVATAGNKAAGRSSTLQYFLGSEIAFWPNTSEHLAGVMQAVPDTPGTEVIFESTANGLNEFYNLWKDAEDGIGEYVPIFIPWFRMPEYARDPAGLEFTAEEREFQKTYKLTDAQLAFRRHKIWELKSEALFSQEYPSTAEDAFIYSGRPVFDPIFLTKAKQGVLNPIARCEVVNGALRERADGELRIWSQPSAGTKYVLGADVAEGLEHGDFSVADILEVPSGRQVAQWHGHCPPDVFADIIAAIAKHWNMAKVAVENNNHGWTTLSHLVNNGYENLYHQRQDGGKSKLGWNTNTKTKYRTIDALASELRDETHGIVCEETLREMRTYVINEKGQYEATPGCHDDRVMSRAIAGECLRSAMVEQGSDYAVGSATRVVTINRDFVWDA